jgi:hypothetical protein
MVSEYNTDDIIPDIRNKINYLIPIIFVSMIVVVSYELMQIMFSNESQGDFIVSCIILTFALLLVIPIKYMQQISKSTKPIVQKIFVNNIFDAILNVSNNNTMEEKVLDIMNNYSLKINDENLQNKMKYKGKKIINNYELNIFQKSPKVEFPKRLYTPRDLVIGKHFNEKQVSQKDISEMYKKIEKSLKNKKESIKIFCIGENFDDEFNDDEFVEKLIKQFNFSHYLILLKYDHNEFEVVWIGNNY